jgi:hypothetical protein
MNKIKLREFLYARLPGGIKLLLYASHFRPEWWCQCAFCLKSSRWSNYSTGGLAGMGHFIHVSSLREHST